MKKTREIVLLLFVLLSTSLSAVNWPQWLDEAVFYQIYPSSFKDSDGDGIGDLRGIISKLDYVKSLGVNVIWMNPIFESAWFDGGYDITDFYKIDPRFGTNTDLVDLVNEAHKRGIKICLDLVAGHTSNKCEWFKQSSQADRNQRYSDYYIWTDSISDDEKKEILLRNKEPNPEESTMGRYVESNSPRAKYYEKNFYQCQPALNYGFANPDPKCPWQQGIDSPGPKALRQEMKNIMAFWMDKGVDGFRVDMASSLVKNDWDKKETMKLWHEMRAWMDTNYPENVLISEWSVPDLAIPAGFHIDFLIYGTPAIPSLIFGKESPWKYCNPYDYCYFDKSGKGRIDDFVTYYQKVYDETKSIGYMSIPTSTHDRQRLNAGDRNTIDQLKVAMTFFMTMPGVPLIYYGDEIGMKFIKDLPSKEGSLLRSGIRTPMQWKNDETAGFSTCSPEKLYLPVFTDGGKLTVEMQENNSSSMLNYTKGLLSLRKLSPALGNTGDWEVISDINVPYPLVYRRYSGDENYIIVINPSDKQLKVKVKKQEFNKAELVYAFGKGNYIKGKSDDVVKVAPVSSLIFKLNK